MTFESDMTFSMVKTLLTVFMTLLLVSALTDFKYSRKKILAVYNNNLRYYTQILYAMLQNGDTDQAIEAMKSIPAGRKKRLEFISTSQPQLAFEIANTCSEGIPFAADGLPVGRDGLPDIRTRSILAFARGHQAMLDCRMSSGMFRLSLIMSNR